MGPRSNPETSAGRGEAGEALSPKARDQKLGQAALSAEAAAERPDPREQLRERVQYWSGEYTTVERQFAQYAAAETTKVASDAYFRSLRKYEEDAGFNWRQLEKSTAEAQTGRAVSGIYDTAQLQSIGTFTISPEKSIEAAVGCFYDERMSALQSSIESSPDLTPDERAQQVALLHDTWPRVNAYLQATGDYETLHDGPEGYENYHRIRNTCHNQMIQQLNQLNDLARTHGLTPFTPRNFITNSFEYNSRFDRGGYLNSRAEYDRETVLSYFAQVFAKDFRASSDRISPSSGRSKMAEIYANLR